MQQCYNKVDLLLGQLSLLTEGYHTLWIYYSYLLYITLGSLLRLHG